MHYKYESTERMKLMHYYTVPRIFWGSFKV